MMEKISEDHEIACYLSGAGERTVRIYGLWEKLRKICPGNYYTEIVLERKQGHASPLTGRFQRGRHRILVISPASANTVAKIVNGIADTLVTNAFAQADKGNIPILITPTDQKDEKNTVLPHVIDRKICRNELGKSHDKCEILDACPYDSIQEIEDLPKIDLTKCEGCGKCLKNCPYGAVSFKKETKINVREMDLKNVENLRRIKNAIVVKNPTKLENEIKKVI